MTNEPTAPTTPTANKFEPWMEYPVAFFAFALAIAYCLPAAIELMIVWVTRPTASAVASFSRYIFEPLLTLSIFDAIFISLTFLMLIAGAAKMMHLIFKGLTWAAKLIR